jgi:hypothetical protein
MTIGNTASSPAWWQGEPTTFARLPKTRKETENGLRALEPDWLVSPFFLFFRAFALSRFRDKKSDYRVLRAVASRMTKPPMGLE